MTTETPSPLTPLVGPVLTGELVFLQQRRDPGRIRELYSRPSNGCGLRLPGIGAVSGRRIDTELNVQVRQLTADHTGGDTATFTDMAGIEPDGALLVRPDHFVAWRSPAFLPHLETLFGTPQPHCSADRSDRDTMPDSRCRDHP